MGIADLENTVALVLGMDEQIDDLIKNSLGLKEAVIAALLEIELRLTLGSGRGAWTFPAATAGHGWSESGRQLVSVYERGMKP